MSRGKAVRLTGQMQCDGGHAREETDVTADENHDCVLSCTLLS